MTELQGRVAFITGAANGLGLEIARTYAQAGAKVVLSDMNEDAIKTRVTEFENAGHDVIGVVCNVQSEEDIKRAVAQTMEQYGQLDILVNNAGMQYVSPVEDFPTETFERMIDIMLTGPFRLIKEVFSIMKEQQYGRVINMASINGLIGYAGKSAYNSAKHGLIGLTKVSALEGAAHGITVNALCPGYVRTDLVQKQLNDLSEERNVSEEQVLEDVFYPLIPQKRLLETEEIAHYALFLAREQSKGITGQANAIDGGYTVQ
ncbi:3-hydroxybutyrate dehydrogenase [Geomicrobium sp. JCM 19055]|uniref:3-hydroxybutyrate dehydrogenase n=1 Tax=Geomicrobium sp. JCM 19055 TaxID=1460649 RepID=UPI00045ECCAE|nr:3-hydroxybutyrate dehydrogenase [Geomicrobium sp. JCM 19055]GAK00730.1 D-beta-hydroxybutyrate dehydrogenase [Geomicrobium sp. JCM 19055]